MAVNKNFVIKNGIEVADNLIFGTSDLQKVGIGSTVPGDTLDVRGGIAATNIYAAGITTSADNFYVGASGTVFAALTGFGSVGVGTANPVFPLEVRSNASTGTTALYVYGDMRVTGDINLDDITLDDVNATDLHVSGLSTMAGDVTLAGSINQLNITGVTTGINAAGVSTFVQLDVGTGGVDVDGQIDLDELVVAGVSTYSALVDINAGVNVAGGAYLDQVVVAGVTTFSGSFPITPDGGSGAGSTVGNAGGAGIVTFYGDGSGLTDVTASSGGAIGLSSGGTSIGTGVTTLNIVGGSSTAAVDGTTGTIYLPAAGVSLGLAIALGG